MTIIYIYITVCEITNKTLYTSTVVTPTITTSCIRWSPVLDRQPHSLLYKTTTCPTGQVTAIFIPQDNTCVRRLYLLVWGSQFQTTCPLF